MKETNYILVFPHDSLIFAILGKIRGMENDFLHCSRILFHRQFDICNIW